MSGFRQVEIDLDAITANVSHLRELIKTEHFVAVVKANGYGHGAVLSARAALAGGATWLGVADLDEALELRAAGITAPILAWLHGPHTDFAPALRADISIGVSSLAQLDAVAAAQENLGLRWPVSVQLKLDTGLSRNGASSAEWEDLFERSQALERSGAVRIEGIFSHLSTTSAQEDLAAGRKYDEGLTLAQSYGLSPSLRHIAATAGALLHPELRYNTVRVGLGIYGLSPLEGQSAADLGLKPAMTVRAEVSAVRRIEAGTGVSYGYTYRSETDTTLALVPVGYADGIPRRASGRASVAINGEIVPLAGRIAMDQFVVDVGDLTVTAGDEVVIFGDPLTGVPGAEDWAHAADTINYEIVSRIGPRPARTHIGAITK